MSRRVQPWHMQLLAASVLISSLPLVCTDPTTRSGGDSLASSARTARSDWRDGSHTGAGTQSRGQISVGQLGVVPTESEMQALEITVRNELLQDKMQPNFWSCPEFMNEYRWKPFVAPVLHNGLGNLLFAIAGACSFAHQLNLPCIVGYWRIDRSTKDPRAFEPWGGHPPPFGPHIQLGHVFPALQWLSCHPRPPVGTNVLPDLVLEGAFENYVNQGEPLLIHSWFFTTRWWNHSLITQLLQPHAAVIRGARQAYFRYLHSMCGDQCALFETVSVHMRIGYANETDPDALAQRRLPPSAFYRHVFKQRFSRRTTIYLVFSDNPQEATWRLRAFRGIKFRVVDANAITSLVLMTMCHHHVLTTSTLSFWGAFLPCPDCVNTQDPPPFPRARPPATIIYHGSFEQTHGPTLVAAMDGWGWIKITNPQLRSELGLTEQQRKNIADIQARRRQTTVIPSV
ncbi:uncharacterized protein MONBRDRAFT_6001 [Monosiga brevicollis MX1]|uniref:L-Fucosyltransferase n=1 Tax=Monosiga brevicollis TaxID=81824 RepID=A9URA3_MONBE|nr:uncharacterized protein MONBRDRAFT_6001 [Monosiga brevicollis MX1]EDQ92207.1 predicted protein [Monosiga brevicollis MX1]|eukprot:XP_001743493.1 hypothetical protein [Monosiga brevicollis MX1]